MKNYESKEIKLNRQSANMN